MAFFACIAFIVFFMVPFMAFFTYISFISFTFMAFLMVFMVIIPHGLLHGLHGHHQFLSSPLKGSLDILRKFVAMMSSKSHKRVRQRNFTSILSTKPTTPPLLR